MRDTAGTRGPTGVPPSRRHRLIRLTWRPLDGCKKEPVQTKEGRELVSGKPDISRELDKGGRPTANWAKTIEKNRLCLGRVQERKSLPETKFW